MKNICRTVLLSTWISGIVLAFGCGGDTSPPLAPSPAAVADGSQRATGKPSPAAVADGSQRAAVSHGPAAAWNDGVGVPASASSLDGDVTGLKSTAPAPVSPIDVQFRTFRPVYLCIVACRVATGPVFATAPRQSDYVSAWNGGTGAGRAARSGCVPSSATCPTR